MKKLKDKYPKKIVKNFQLTFDNQKPDEIYFAPGRVNFIGEHIDYNGGKVLPIALKHRTYFAFKKTDKESIRLFSKQENELYEAKINTPVNRKDWAAYVIGMAKLLGYNNSFDAYIDSKVPISAGLSSSAAIECACGVAFFDKKNGKIDDDNNKIKIALTGQKTENDIIGAPTGIMDQAISMLGKKNHALLLNTNNITFKYIPFNIKENNLELLVIESGVKHSTSDGSYAERKAACEKAAKILKVKNLVDASLGDLEKIYDSIVKKRAKHVITEHIRVNECVEAMEKSDWKTVGKLLTASHASMRDDYEISTPELDLLVFIANKYGALGSRLTGAGFGGCVISLIPKKQRRTILNHIEIAFDEKGYLTPKYLIAKPSNGAGKKSQ